MTPSDDKKLWQAYARGVRRKISNTLPLREDRPAKLAGEGLNKPDSSPAKTKDLLCKSRFLQPLPQGERSKIFDRRTERALRRGTIEIDARLDLHGMTQVEAYAALERFMAAQVKLGHRHLLIITGKGSKGHSVLRANLPQWLESLPAAATILELRTASVKHGGSGAFYVILRRRKK